MPLSLKQRLNIIKGQIDGVSRLLDQQADCRRVVEQFFAIQSALQKVTEVYLTNNLKTCFRQLKNDKKDELRFLLHEIIKHNK